MKKIKFKRFWISAIGWILAIGFINNFLVHPFANINLVDWGGLISSLGVLLAISGTRDYFLRNSINNLPENKTGKGWQRWWIPTVGWALAGGYFVNCVIAPYAKINCNDWVQLTAVLSVMLGISGARDVSLHGTKKELPKE